jgi:hypothetical protein
MIAPARRRDAATTVSAYPSKRVYELWSEAVSIRQEWLGHALSTEPADRPAAERAIAAIYARVGRPRPHVEWVDSPYKALPLVAGGATLGELYRWINGRVPQGRPPLASDLAALVSALRSSLWAGLADPDPELSPPKPRRSAGRSPRPWPDLPPREALAFGVPFAVVLDRGVRRMLFRSLAGGLYLRVRSALPDPATVPVCWYGQHDASWVAYYDTLARLGLARYGGRESRHFDDWAALVRSCGWWWPGEQRCVVIERPARVVTGTLPGTDYGEVGMCRDGLTYRDGWRPAV